MDGLQTRQNAKRYISIMMAIAKLPSICILARTKRVERYLPLMRLLSKVNVFVSEGSNKKWYFMILKTKTECIFVLVYASVKHCFTSLEYYLIWKFWLGFLIEDLIWKFGLGSYYFCIV